jgi:hypothetical protein
MEVTIIDAVLFLGIFGGFAPALANSAEVHVVVDAIIFQEVFTY